MKGLVPQGDNWQLRGPRWQLSQVTTRSFGRFFKSGTGSFVITILQHDSEQRPDKFYVDSPSSSSGVPQRLLSFSLEQLNEKQEATVLWLNTADEGGGLAPTPPPPTPLRDGEDNECYCTLP